MRLPSRFKRSVPVDGVQVEVNLAPTCLAAEMARQNPAHLGAKLKECYLRSDGATVREMLVPVVPTEERKNKKFSRSSQQVLPRPKSPTASPPPLVEGVMREVVMGEHPGQSE